MKSIWSNSLKFNRGILATIAGGCSLASYQYYDDKQSKLNSFNQPRILKSLFSTQTASCYGEQLEDLPTYRKTDVQKAAMSDKKVWVTFRDGVYDLEAFVKQHPGGSEKILMAVGGPIEAFWQQYKFHKHGNIYQLLSRFKIGRLHEDDIINERDLPDFTDIQTQAELERSDELIVKAQYPFCAETNPKYLSNFQYFYTPPKQLFERNHGLVPQVDLVEDEYVISLQAARTDEAEENAIEVDFDQLKALGSQELTCLMECAGNKRKWIQEKYKTINGLRWGAGAIGNVVFKGVPMRTILLDVMKLKEEDLAGKHLVAMGVDTDFQGKHFEISIPMEIALDPKREVMLAYEMNGEDLSPTHGYPVRLVCPGLVGVRWCKWVGKIIVSNEEADHGVQRRNYKIIKDTADVATVKWDAYAPHNFQVVNSAIAYPQAGDEITVSKDDKFIEISGWAHGDGEKGTQANRVEISSDGGKTWAEADEYIMEYIQPERLCFSWTMWKYKLPLTDNSTKLNLIVRAFTTDGQGQNGTIETSYNMRGIMNAAPHEVDFSVIRQAQ